MSASSSTTRILTPSLTPLSYLFPRHEHRVSGLLARSGNRRTIDNVANESSWDASELFDADRKPSLLPCALLGVAASRRPALRAGGSPARRASPLVPVLPVVHRRCRPDDRRSAGRAARAPRAGVAERAAAPGRTAGRVRIRRDVDRCGRGGGRLRPERPLADLGVGTRSPACRGRGEHVRAQRPGAA